MSTLEMMVIDDCPGDARLIAETVKEVSGWDVDVAWVATPIEAVVRLERRVPDVALIDFNLVGTTGPEVITTLRGRGFDGPAIVLTGVGDEHTATRAFRAGAADYLPKDRISPASLHRAVTNAVERHRLAREVKQHQEQLVNANADLMRRNDEIKQFYHQVSHELRTPLTAAREFISMALDGLAGPINDELADMLGTACSCCDRITRFLDDLIDATRIETKRLAIEPVEVEITPLLNALVGGLAPLAAHKSIALSVHADEELGMMTVDPDRFAQVVNNLVGNAIKFSEAGSEVIITARRGDDRLEFSVQDFGCGIASNDAERIFDRLYQVRTDELTTGEGGLGLGLHICREIAELHGGEILVESRLGAGSTFTFTIPLQKLGCLR